MSLENIDVRTRPDERRSSHVSDRDPIIDGHRTNPGDHYPSIECRSIVETCGGRPDECTICPPVSEEPLGTTEWITAREGSYVAIEEML